MNRITALLILLFSTMIAQARPLTDLVDIQGLRDNQLIGYGLVVGLAGTGDRNQVRFTSQSMTNMLKQFGVQLPSNVDPNCVTWRRSRSMRLYPVWPVPARPSTSPYPPLVMP